MTNLMNMHFVNVGLPDASFRNYESHETSSQRCATETTTSLSNTIMLSPTTLYEVEKLIRTIKK